MAAPVRTATPCLGENGIPAHRPLAGVLHRPLDRVGKGQGEAMLNMTASPTWFAD